jgi:hypothetical protein
LRSAVAAAVDVRVASACVVIMGDLRLDDDLRLEDDLRLDEDLRLELATLFSGTGDEHSDVSHMDVGEEGGSVLESIEYTVGVETGGVKVDTAEEIEADE